jgi:hypothetical protein
MYVDLGNFEAAKKYSEQALEVCADEKEKGKIKTFIRAIENSLKNEKVVEENILDEDLKEENNDLK